MSQKSYAEVVKTSRHSKISSAKSKVEKPKQSKSDGSRSGHSEWPISLKEYVTRAFNNCTDATRDAVERELHEIVNISVNNGTMWDTGWDEKPLPSSCNDHKSKRKGNSPNDKTENFLPESIPNLIDMSEKARRDKRLKRFQNDSETSPPPRCVQQEAPLQNNNDVIDWDRHTIVGTSTKLEKEYLRLTAAPDPATVRPPHILRRTLNILKDKWNTEHNYSYICDQLKSVRQDLTVQRIKNELTVQVYEIHARIALEKADLGEYNQCQSQLKILYEYKIPGHVMEFTAYRLLYLLHTRNRVEINAMMAELKTEHKANANVRHALAVRSALANGDYHSFFRLYRDAPCMGGHLMDCFVERERVATMVVLCKAYKVTIAVPFVSRKLGFDTCKECSLFLDNYNTVYTYQLQGRVIDCKASLATWTDAAKDFTKVDIKGQL